MIERARLAAEHIGVLADGEINQSARAKDVDRVFLRVGVEVAQNDHVGIVGGCLHRGDEAQQRCGLPFAHGIPVALAIALIGIGAGTRAAF